MPAVKRVQETYGKDGFVVLGFNSDRTVEKMTAYLKGKGYGGWSHFFMGKQRGAMQSRYWVSGYPTNFLVGRDGKIVSRGIRFGRGHGERLVKQALAVQATEMSGSR